MTGRDRKSQMNKSQPSVLLIEQSGLMSNVIANILHDIGYEDVVRLSCVREAQTWLEQKGFALVICDWYQESNSVLHLLRHIRSTAKTAKLPFLMISGIIEHEAVEKVIALGVSEYIVKPFNAAMLKEKIDAAIRHPIAVPTKRPEHPDIDEFQTKLITCLSPETHNEAINIAISGSDSLCARSIPDAIALVDADKRIDIVLLDENTAQAATKDLNNLLQKVRLAEVDIIFITNNTSDTHIQALNKLGINHIINSETSLYDLPVRISLLTQLKKALLHTNSAVRRAEEYSASEKQQDDVRSELAHSVLSKSRNIKKLTNHIKQNSSSAYITQLGNEIDENVQSIDSLAATIDSVCKLKELELETDKEILHLHDSLQNAQSLFATELSERKLQLIYTGAEQAQIKVNPTLFNSLLMFFIRAFVRDVLFNSEIIINIDDPEESELCQLSITGAFASIPHLRDICERITLPNNGELQVNFKSTIKQLLKSQVKELNYQYDIVESKLIVEILIPLANPDLSDPEAVEESLGE